MSAFFALTKRIIKNTVIPSFSSPKEKKKFIGIIVALALCLGIPYLALLISSFDVVTTAVNTGYLTEVLSMVFLVSQIVTIVFSLFVYINVMYFSKDNEFLLTLPVKSVSIFWAKLIAILLHELIISAVLIIPLSVVIAIAMAKSAIGLSAGFVLLIIPATVLLPLMAILIIALVSYPMMKILTFFKKRPLIGAVLAIILVAGFYIAVYMPLLLSSNSPSTGEFEDESMSTAQAIAEVLPSIAGVGRYSYHTYFLAKAMTTTNALAGFGYAMAFVGIVLAIATVGSLLAVWQYSKLATSSLESGASLKSSAKAKEIKSKDCKKALYVKDLFATLKTTTLLIQTGMMTVVPPILIYFVCQMQNNVEGVLGTLIAISIADLIGKIMLSSNVASILAFSRDGEGVLKYKTLPILAKDIVNAKVLTGLTFSAVTIVLCTVAISFVSNMNAVCVVGFVLSNSVYALAINRFNVYRDLKKPNIHWKNITEITKNNFSSMIPMLISFVPGGLVMLGTILMGTFLEANAYIMGLLYSAWACVVGGVFLLIVKLLSSYDVEEALQRVE